MGDYVQWNLLNLNLKGPGKVVRVTESSNQREFELWRVEFELKGNSNGRELSSN